MLITETGGKPLGLPPVFMVFRHKLYDMDFPVYSIVNQTSATWFRGAFIPGKMMLRMRFGKSIG